MTVSANGNTVVLDAQNVAVVDDRAAPAPDLPSTVTIQMTWKGRRGQRKLGGSSPAFAGTFYRHAAARGIFAAAEEGFTFASNPHKRVRSQFAELGTEQNGILLTAAARCSRCGANGSDPSHQQHDHDDHQDQPGGTGWPVAVRMVSPGR